LEQNKGKKSNRYIPHTVFEAQSNNFLTCSIDVIKITLKTRCKPSAQAWISQPVFNACQTTHNLPGTFEMWRQSTVRRAHAWNNSGGLHLDHLLWTVIWWTVTAQQLLNWECI